MEMKLFHPSFGTKGPSAWKKPCIFWKNEQMDGWMDNWINLHHSRTCHHHWWTYIIKLVNALKNSADKKYTYYLGLKNNRKDSVIMMMMMMVVVMWSLNTGFSNDSYDLLFIILKITMSLVNSLSLFFPGEESSFLGYPITLLTPKIWLSILLF